MKKVYSTPDAEKVSFDYKEQVVASNADTPDKPSCYMITPFTFASRIPASPCTDKWGDPVMNN